jgi:hypothetical protein
MAREVNIGGRNNTLFVGEDKTLRFEILDDDDIPVDITGWTIALVVKRAVSDTSAMISGTATISGVYNASRSLNTQRASVVLTDTQMSVDEAKYRYSVKRTDDGGETILLHGMFWPVRATQV